MSCPNAKALDIKVHIGSVTLESYPASQDNFYLLENPLEIFSQVNVDQDVSKLQGEHGVIRGIPTYGPRNLPFRVRIKASSYPQLLTMEQALLNEMLLPAIPSFQDDGGRQILIDDEYGNHLQTWAVPLDRLNQDVVRRVSQNERAYSFLFYAEDPRLYDQNLTSVTGPESYFTTNFTFQDGSLPTFQDGSLPTFQDVVGNVMTVTNNGAMGSFPVLIIQGPTENPVILNTTTGRKIALTKNGGLTLLEGETVTINEASGEITKSDGSDVSGTRSDDSQRMVLQKGDNQLTMMDDSSDQLDSILTVQYRAVYF